MRKKNDDTRLFIINTAFSLFREHGYNNVTVKEICDACEITRGAFYYYYKTKDDILDDIFMESNQLNLKLINEALAEKHYIDQFYKLFYSYLSRTIEVGAEIFKQVLIRNINKNTKLTHPADVPVYETYITLIEKAQKAGEIANMAPAKVLAESAIYLSNGMGLVWCSKNGSFHFEKELRKLLDSLFLVTITS